MTDDLDPWLSMVNADMTAALLVDPCRTDEDGARCLCDEENG
jgi:hypothetical protein